MSYTKRITRHIRRALSVLGFVREPLRGPSPDRFALEENQSHPSYDERDLWYAMLREEATARYCRRTGLTPRAAWELFSTLFGARPFGGLSSFAR